MQLDAVLADALGFAKSADGPRFAKGDYENAMVLLGEQECRGDETPAVALARLCHKADARMRALWSAARAAEVREAASAERRARLELAALSRLSGAAPASG